MGSAARHGQLGNHMVLSSYSSWPTWSLGHFYKHLICNQMYMDIKVEISTPFLLLNKMVKLLVETED